MERKRRRVHAIQGQRERATRAAEFFHEDDSSAGGLILFG